jgi:hypothetical protein
MYVMMCVCAYNYRYPGEYDSTVLYIQLCDHYFSVQIVSHYINIIVAALLGKTDGVGLKLRACRHLRVGL